MYSPKINQLHNSTMVRSNRSLAVGGTVSEPGTNPRPFDTGIFRIGFYLLARLFNR